MTIKVRLPHLWQHMVNPECRTVQLVQSGRALLIAGPLLVVLVQVFGQVAPGFVAHDDGVVSVCGRGVNVHLCPWVQKRFGREYDLGIFLYVTNKNKPNQTSELSSILHLMKYNNSIEIRIL